MSKQELPNDFEQVICDDVISVPKPQDWRFQEAGPYYHIRPTNLLPQRDPSVGIVEATSMRAGTDLACGRTVIDSRGLLLHILSNITRVYGTDPDTVGGWHFTKDRGMFAPFREVVRTESNGIVTRFGETRRPHIPEYDNECRPPALCYFTSIADIDRDKVYLMTFEAYSSAVDHLSEIVTDAGRIMMAGARVLTPPSQYK